MASPQLIDVHCHLDDPAFYPDLDQVLERANEAGVRVMVVSALVDAGTQRAKEISRTHQNILLSFGAQPQNINSSNYARLLDQLEAEAELGVAIGEVGLDRGREGGEISMQEKFFREAIRLASSKHLSLVVHSRNSGREAIRVLLDENPDVPIDMHAYDGKSSSAAEAARLGIFFSIPPSLLRSEGKIALARKLPIENLLLESDAPALGPRPGERNEPANLLLTLKKLSEIKHETIESLGEALTQNAKRFLSGKL
ncbi:MAG: TatD family hydrolase [Thermoprotei archaeon]|nr:TatD family hydrolase [TACK group archaeon]